MAAAWILFLLAILLAVLAPLIVLSLVGARRRKPDDVSIKLSLCGLLYNLIRRSQGSLPSGWSTGKEGTARVPVPKELRDSLSAIQQEWSVDSQNYSKYCQLCDFVGHLKADKSREPHCYMESAFFGLFLKIISSPDFPVSPIGLIHLRQTMIVYASLRLEELPKFTLEAHVSEIRVVEKGIEIDATASVFSLPGKTLVWEGVTTILSRNKATQSRTRRSPKQGQSPRNEDELLYTGLSSFGVPVDIGWQFAGVCGDYGPHHLNWVTAKLVGYNKAMAHGMWTLSRSLSCILNDEDCQFSSCYPLQIVVGFKRPLFLPASAQVHYCVTEEKGSKVIRLKVTTQKNESLNLEASVVCNAINVSH